MIASWSTPARRARGADDPAVIDHAEPVGQREDEGDALLDRPKRHPARGDGPDRIGRVLQPGRRARLRPVALAARDLPPVTRKLTGAQADDARRAATILTGMAETVAVQPFEAACALIGDPARAVHVPGGRLTDPLTQPCRCGCARSGPTCAPLPTDPEGWPDAVLRMRRRDVPGLFDVRRHEKRLADLAATVVRTRATAIVRVTDRRVSPAARHATHVCAVPIEGKRHAAPLLPLVI